MGVHAAWHNPDQTIICYTFEGGWNWDELYLRRDWVRQEMTTVDHAVSLIVDMRGTRHVPPNSLVHLRAAAERVNPNYSGRTVYVGTGTLGPALGALLYKLNPALRAKYQVFFTATLEEAERLLDDRQKEQGKNSE